MLEYDFGPHHPLKPERLERTVRLLTAMGGTEVLDPGLGEREDVLRVHDAEYVAAVETIGCGMPVPGGFEQRYGFGSLDNPAFLGMYEASLAYCAGTVEAAKRVRDGAPLAFGMAGGLHHAHRARASGFCIFNDAAIALTILRERFGRVAYVDIDLHHGDGVQWLFYEDPTVLTCSIHQEGSHFYPGTGWVTEAGPAHTSVNVPLAAGTTGDVWLDAFERGILRALERFEPEAIVLQMGCDPHELDPLGQLRLSVQEWLGAVERVRDLERPIVAVGGGGYRITNVPRMWVAACLALARKPHDDRVPEPFAGEWRMPRFFDPELPGPREGGRAYAERTLHDLTQDVLPNIPRS
ncbi:MAG: acetoin utilization protein AcuC [Fimbriimonadaceae bacterium]|nr:acetoin utilization protein AcuC [Fimbriimonadaceae bacterium]